jgi:hypothetical protein
MLGFVECPTVMAGDRQAQHPLSLCHQPLVEFLEHANWWLGRIGVVRPGGLLPELFDRSLSVLVHLWPKADDERRYRDLEPLDQSPWKIATAVGHDSRNLLHLDPPVHKAIR